MIVTISYILELLINLTDDQLIRLDEDKFVMELITIHHGIYKTYHAQLNS